MKSCRASICIRPPAFLETAKLVLVKLNGCARSMAESQSGRELPKRASCSCFTCQLHVPCYTATALGHELRAAFEKQRATMPERNAATTLPLHVALLHD